ncbi:hypothetical protein MTO96_018804 [Rhipicephalus appendiculatus]
MNQCLVRTQLTTPAWNCLLWPNAASTSANEHRDHEQEVRNTSAVALDVHSNVPSVNEGLNEPAGVDVIAASRQASVEVKRSADAASTTFLPGKTTATLSPPAAIQRQSSNAGSPAGIVKSRHSAGGASRKSKKKPSDIASPYGTLQKPASVIPESGTPALVTPALVTPASGTPAASPSLVTTSSRASSPGPTASEHAIGRPLKAKLDKAELTPQARRKSQRLQSSSRGPGVPAAPTGERQTKVTKATRAPGDAHDKETKQEAGAMLSGATKVSPAAPLPPQEHSSKELSGHGPTAAASSQCISPIASTVSDGSGVPELLPGARDRDHEKLPGGAEKLGGPPPETGRPPFQERRPSPTAKGVKRASSVPSGPSSPSRAESTDKLLFQGPESELVVGASPMSGKPSTPARTSLGHRTSLSRKMSRPLSELRKFRLDSRTLAAASPVHSTPMQIILHETLGDRGQWMVAFIVALVFIAVIVAFILRNNVVAKKQPTDLCNTPACLSYAGHILLQVNRSRDPCQDFSAYVCSAWNPPVTRADYATSSFTQLIRAWFDALRDLLERGHEARIHGRRWAGGHAAGLLEPPRESGLTGHSRATRLHGLSSPTLARPARGRRQPTWSHIAAVPRFGSAYSTACLAMARAMML